MITTVVVYENERRVILNFNFKRREKAGRQFTIFLDLEVDLAVNSSI